MKKRTLLISTCAALTLPLVGMASHGGDHFEQGFYFGGAAGISRLKADFNQTLTAGYAVTSAAPLHYLDSDNQSFDEDRSVGMGQLQLGYALAWEWLFVGLEVSVNGSSLNLDKNNEFLAFDDIFDGYLTILQSESNVELNNFEPVADLKLGFTLPTRTYLYARVGAAFNELALHETTTFDQYAEFRCDGACEHISQYFRTGDSDSVVALRLGAGIEHRFFDQVSVALDYVHTDYGSVSTSGAQLTRFIENNGSDVAYVFNDTKVDVARDVVTLGVNYYFW